MEFREIVEPKSPAAKDCLISAYRYKGMYQEAISQYQKFVAAGDTSSTQCYLGYALSQAGKKSEAQAIQEKLRRDPFGGQVFVFRGRRGYLLKALWWDGQGLCLFAKRLEKGRFVWPSPADGSVVLTPAQLGMLLEGIDWRMPVRTWQPRSAG